MKSLIRNAIITYHPVCGESKTAKSNRLKERQCFEHSSFLIATLKTIHRRWQ
jgi:hypothetical protein